MLGNEFSLSPENSHYISNVVRLTAGDPVFVTFEQKNIEFECFVTEVSNGSVKVKLSKIASGSEYFSRVDFLLPALCKGEANEFIIEKATELGVKKIIFWISKRSIIRFKSDAEMQKKQDRYFKIAESAARQSGRRSIPDVHIVSSIEDSFNLVKVMNTNQFLGVLSLGAHSKPVGSFRNKLLECQSAIIVTGAEGDFDPLEAQFLALQGFEEVSLGGNRLRAETASIAGIAAIDAIISSST